MTVLPGVLAWLGRFADRGRIPFIGRRRTAAGRSRLWAALVRRVVRRPVAWGGAAAIALLGARRSGIGHPHGNAGLHQLPASVPVVQTLIRMQKAFPGGPAPAEVVVTGPDLSGPQVRAAITALRGRAAASHGGLASRSPRRSPAAAAYCRLGAPGRRWYRPGLGARPRPTARQGTAATWARSAGSATRWPAPRQRATTSPPPCTLARRWSSCSCSAWRSCCCILSFRSVAIPLTAISLNLLSVGAAYGLLKLVFQDGHFEHLLGFTSYGGIIPYLPLFMFVLLFGLSMDYHVFILSRIRELRAAAPPPQTPSQAASPAAPGS